MNSLQNGTCTLEFSVTTITDLGFWILVEDKEYFVPFEEYPAFRDATVKQILNLTFMPPSQLHWESLDADLELHALENPEMFPMVFRQKIQ